MIAVASLHRCDVDSDIDSLFRDRYIDLHVSLDSLDSKNNIRKEEKKKNYLFLAKIYSVRVSA